MLATGDEILDFITGGKAIFTVKNRATGGRATYRVEADGEGAERTYAVAAFTGSDNCSKDSYTLMGVMNADGVWKVRTQLDEYNDLSAAVLAKGDRWVASFLKTVATYRAKGWKLTPKMEKRLGIELRRHKVAGYVTDRTQLVAFPWLWRQVTEGKTLPETLEVWHEGNCCRCARRLTVPASIETGLGYDCATTVGKAEEWSRLDKLLGQDLVAYAERLAARKAA